MKKLKLFSSIGVGLALAAAAFNVNAQSSTTVSSRIAELERAGANPIITLSSNTTAAQVNFSLTRYGEQWYQVTNLAGNLALSLTNLTDGAVAQVFIKTDGTARTVTINTNGLTRSTQIIWDFGSVTNGATSFTATNYARVTLRKLPGGYVQAMHALSQ